MLGKMQFKLQKLIDNYVSPVLIAYLNQISVFPWILFSMLLTAFAFQFQRSHIFQTITIPSESLLNELRIVEVCSYKPFHV